MGDITIKVENLGKLYRLGEVGTGTLSHDLNRWWARFQGKEDPFAKIGETNNRTVKGASDYVWSLKDINFEVKQGEVLGIIGRNGAGKSTLLKILSKITSPTTGRISIKGRIASLLEVGTGFHPELTGRENIFLNGAILGMSKTEIRNKFDEIVDFAGVDRYIDTPVKRYSSGMYVRLAFAVAAHLEPEILIVDEVLAVGDAEFQKKALGKMQKVSSEDGRTVLFVSHSMPSIKNLCTSGLLMENGSVLLQGSANEVVDYYVSNYVNFRTDTKIIVDNSYRHRDLSRVIEFETIGFDKAVESNYYATNDDIGFVLRMKGLVDKEGFRIAFSINKLDESTVGIFWSNEIFSIKQGQSKELLVTLKNHQLAKGQYFVDFSVGVGNEITGYTDYDNVIKTLFFEIAYKDKDKTQMITMWPPAWGSINFQNVDLKFI